MSPLGRLIQRFWLFYFSKPAADRPLYKAICGKTIRSVVEIGIADQSRTRKLWDVLAWRVENLPLKYTGIDLFDSRPKDQPALLLKQAFALLRRDGVTVNLIPGDPQSALNRSANSLTGTDLLLVSRNLASHALAPAWRWVPRMLHAGTIIFQEVADTNGAPAWQRLSIVEIQKRAAEANKAARRAAA